MYGSNTILFRHISSFKFGAGACEYRLEVIIFTEGHSTKFVSSFFPVLDGGAVGRVTAPEAGRLQVRFHMGSWDFFFT